MTWWRRNRWGLIVLPFALALALVATASRFQMFWWNEGPNAVTEGSWRHPVSFTEPWKDRDGEHTRALTVTLVDVRPALASRIPKSYFAKKPLRLPEGTKAWQVVLSVDAAPEQVLQYCRLALIDSRDREFEYDSKAFGDDADLNVTPCTPKDQLGPEANYWGVPPVETQTRPQKYTVTAYLLTAADAVPARVRLWWTNPNALEVPIPR